MAEVPCGSFSIRDNQVHFSPSKHDTSYEWKHFEQATENLNKNLNRFPGVHLVEVCANRTTVFVALNFEIPRMGLVYEMKIDGGTSFENEIATKMSKSIDSDRVRWLKDECQIKSISSSGKKNAVVLQTDDKNMGCVFFKIESEWRRCPVTILEKEQNISKITCDENHCTASTADGDEFICEWPATCDLPQWRHKTNRSHLRADGHVHLRYKTVGTFMSSTFGTTGTFGNPYLLNMNTDGPYAEKLAEMYDKRHSQLTSQHASNIEKHEQDLIKARQAHGADMLQHNAAKATHLRKVETLETELEGHEAAHAEHVTKLQEAERKLKEAQALHEELTVEGKTRQTKMSDIKKQLNGEHAVVTGGTRVSREMNPENYPLTHGSGTVYSSTPDTNPSQKSKSVFAALANGLHRVQQNAKTPRATRLPLSIDFT